MPSPPEGGEGQGEGPSVFDRYHIVSRRTCRRRPGGCTGIVLSIVARIRLTGVP